MYLLQVFLALPTNCPTDPDGSPRSTDGQIKADSVVLYASADEAQTFEQVFPKPWSFCVDSPEFCGHVDMTSQEQTREWPCTGMSASEVAGPGLQSGEDTRWCLSVLGG